MSGDDGQILFDDPKSQQVHHTTMQIRGEYWETWTDYGYPVVEHWVADAKGRVFGATSDGFLFPNECPAQTGCQLG